MNVTENIQRASATESAGAPRGSAAMVSPVRLMVTLLAGAFVAQGAIMVGLSLNPEMPEQIKWVIDSTLLGVLLIVPLWLFACRPMRRALSEYAVVFDRLARSEERHRALFESSRDAIMTLEPPSWRFTSGNPATVSTFRVASEQDFIAHEPWSLSPESQPDGSASVDKAREMIETAMREGSHFFEWTHVRIDGEKFPATVLLTRMVIEGKTFLQATVRDITAQKQAEAALHESEQRYRALFEGAAEGILVADAETREFRYANPAICALLGYTVEELIHMDVRGIHPEESLPVVIAAFEAQARGELTMASDLPCLRKDGGVIYASINTAPVEIGDRPCLVAFFTDNSERWRVKEELRLSKAFLDNVVNAIADPVFVKDDTRRFVLVNDALCTIVGRPRESLIGEDGDDMFPPEQVGVFRRVDAQVLENGEENLNEEALSNLSTGEVRTIVTRKSRCIDHTGKPFIVGVIRDISERKRIEAELQRQQKMAAVGTLAGGAGHEINNPLNGIMNYAQLIKDKLEPDSPLAEYAGAIIVEAERIASVTRGLLTLAAEDGATRAPAHINAIVDSTLAPIRAALTRDQVALEVDVPDSLPAITCDGKCIQRVLMALISNAHDALNEKYAGFDENKKLMITARLMDKDGHPRIRTTVEDSGTGIPEGLLERVFEPFFTTKDRAGGSGNVGKGMGLFISYAFVQEHEGALTIESEEGQWTRVHMDLPIAPRLRSEQVEPGTGK